ncbi:MAG: Sun protein, partial [Zetaproteobacteria bacterium CG02_land_8_20_14_3_00_50_9]
MNVRQYAIQSLDRIVYQGHKADIFLDHAPVEESGLLHELIYGVLRHAFSLEADVSRFLKDKPENVVRAALLLGAYQIRHMRVPAFAAVDETVT